jgi:hypothetical protein
MSRSQRLRVVRPPSTGANLIGDSTQNGDNKRDAQHIIDACEANWDANKADCSAFVKAVATALGVTLFDPGDNADAIVDKLSNAPGWNVVPDRATVETQAAIGEFIIAGLKSTEFTPPRNNGHVVVVVNGDDPLHPGYPMAYWGTLNGVGQKDSSIRNAFIPGPDLDSVHYFGTSLPAASEAASLFSANLASSPRFGDISSAVESLISKVAQTMRSTPPAAAENRVFFPNGIELIDLDVKVGAIEIKLTIAGPKSEPKP